MQKNLFGAMKGKQFWKFVNFFFISKSKSYEQIGHLHDDAIWLQVPESFRFCFSHANLSFCYFYLTGNT